jgi:hypothetical protein
VIASFTSLRFTFIGLGEIIFLGMGAMAVVNAFSKPFNNRYIFSGFWATYLLLSLAGFAYNLFVLDLATGTYKGLIFDTAAYVMLLMACLALEQQFIVRHNRAYSYLKGLFFFFVGLMSVLYVVNLYTSNIGGFSLRYYQYFAPFVINVHQIAMLIVPMTFIGMVIYEREKGFYIRLLIVALIGMTILMLVATGATKAMLGLVIGACGYVAARLQKNQSTVAKFMTLLIIISSFLLLLIQGDILLYAQLFFQEADAQGGRAHLYSGALQLISESWLIGRGNGAHIFYQGKFDDAHQTLLTTLLQAGILGCFFFIRLMFRMLLKAYTNSPAIFAAICTIMVYVVGGDILRRLPIWLVLLILYHTLCQMGDDKGQERKVR